jgi:hypothetical protein
VVAPLRSLPVLLAAAIAGCFTSATDVLQTPSGSWSRRDCLTVMASSMRHNLNDNESNVQVIVTPYIPTVVEAIARMQQLDDSADDGTVRDNLDVLLKSGVGLFIDRENNGRLANARGNYYRHPRELDSLLFLVMLNNRSWPCAVPLQTVHVIPGVYGMRPIAGLADWPCTTPEIHDLDRKILLINAAGDTLRPKFIWGRNNEVLTMEEHVFVLFDFSADRERSFLKESDAVTMVLSGFDRPVKFLFPLEIPG